MPLSFSCEQEEQQVSEQIKRNHLDSSDEALHSGKPSCEAPLLGESHESTRHPVVHSQAESPDHQSKHVFISEGAEDDASSTGAALQRRRRDSDQSDSVLEQSVLSDNYLTMSGTIKRGKKKSQSIEVVLNMSREELEVLEAAITKEDLRSSWSVLRCTGRQGMHVLLWSLLCMPLSFLLSAAYAFAMGTMTWYNVFTYWTEEKPVWCRILVSPWLILLYPFVIVLLSAGLGLYACVVQVSLHWDAWLKEFVDFEKGFYGWVCNVVDLPDCAPYQVVILSGIGMHASGFS